MRHFHLEKLTALQFNYLVVALHHCVEFDSVELPNVLSFFNSNRVI